jgi:3-oxoacyl-[acyl-carrier-protein] synthase II
VGEVKNFDPLEHMPTATARKTDRFAQFGIAVAGAAIKDAKLEKSPKLKNAAVIFGSGLGGSNFHEETVLNFVKSLDPKQIAASSVPRITPNAVTAQIALQYGILGKNYVISTACSSSSNAIGEAFNAVRNGEYQIVLAGGVEATISCVNILMYQSMMVLGSAFDGNIASASRPFDFTRNGFVMAEGAACLILESLESAMSRNCEIYAEVIGFKSGCGGYHMVAPNPTGEDAQKIMEQALSDAGVKPEEVDVIYAHGTSTKYNDAAETKAIKLAFGSRANKIPVSALKSMVGHTIGASAAIQSVALCLCLKSGIVSPTINLATSDPECDLDYVPNSSRKGDFRIGISNAFGFGSNNSVLVFKRR